MQNTMPDWVALDGSDPSLKINLHTNHYGFAKTANALPLAQSEFELACKHYPIVFIAANETATVLQSVALMSFSQADNLFVRPDQSWEPYCYIPAYAKRHPFQLGLAQDQQNYMVYVDQNYAGLNQAEGMAFFEKGEPSDYLNQLSHALRTLETELNQTQKWVMRLKEKGLLVERSVSISLNEKTEQIAGVWVVDTAKLADLDDKELAQMYHNGTLALIEQHRLSLSNLDQLAARASV